ncbi:MAG: InlB B-repeat-containing protein [Lachnospiraceae bacterium]|nr:InlB B-repeat-containing protein [Lachnospiraceae bacterium]
MITGRRWKIQALICLLLCVCLPACGGNPAPQQVATVMDVAVKTAPTKEYTVGEEADFSDGVLTLFYTDDTTKDVPFTYEGVNISVPDMSTPGKKTVGIDYDGFTASFSITVNGKSYTVRFNPNTPDNAGAEERSVADGNPVSRPDDDPKREGYAFAGWFTGAEGGEEFDFTTRITQDMELFAQWKRVYTVTFDFNSEEFSEDGKVQVSEGSLLPQSDIPAVQAPEGFVFDGWYTEAEGGERYGFSEEIHQDLTLYARWDEVKEEETILTVTFDLGQEGAENTTAQVKQGSPVAKPVDPAIEGRSFEGWHTDKEEDTPYDFEQEVTEDLILYARWKVSFYVVEYKYAIDGKETSYTKKQVTPNVYLARDAVPMPAAEGYVFAAYNWYVDPECTEMFDFSRVKVNENLVLYAKPLRRYTFEAEYTYIDPEKSGLGSSNAVSGVGLLGEDDGSAGASEGFWMSNLFYSGAYVEFDIVSDREVTDAILTMRLSADWEDMFIAPKEQDVNGQKYYGFVVSSGKAKLDASGNPVTASLGSLVAEEEESYSYEPIALTGAISFSDSITEKRPFDDHLVTRGLHLYEGMNVIRLTVNNSHSHDGSMAAEAPMVDCIYVETDAELSWTAHTENIDLWYDEFGY